MKKKTKGLIQRFEGPCSEKASFDYGKPIDQLTFDNPITKFYHVGGFGYGIIPRFKIGFKVSEQKVCFDEVAKEAGVDSVDIPDESVLAAIHIHYRKDDFFLWGLSFFNKQWQCILEVGSTPAASKYQAVHEIVIEQGERLIGMMSCLLYAGERAECKGLQLIFGKLS